VEPFSANSRETADEWQEWWPTQTQGSQAIGVEIIIIIHIKVIYSQQIT